MKRKILLALMVLCLAWVFWNAGGRNPATVTVEADEVGQASAAPVPAGLSQPSAQEETKEAAVAETESGDISVSLPAVAPQTLFPNAKVLSRIESEPDSSGMVKVIKTVETDMKQRFVRVEETYIDGRTETANLIEQNAMVANQLLTQKPAAMAEDRFVQILANTGASEVKKVGDGFLVTYQAEPSNPLALDTFISRVKSAVSGLVVEPNYIRKLF